MFIKKHLFGVMFGVLLTAFSVYVLLDTFFIVRTYEVVGLTDYQSGNIEIKEEEQEKTLSVVPETILTTSEQRTDSATSADNLMYTLQNTDIEIEDAPVYSNVKESTVTDTGYCDENIAVSLSEYRIEETTVYVADVTISNPEYLKTAFANNAYGRNVTATTSQTANAVDAILAVNGDYYGAQQTGYVIRNGVLYRNTPRKNAEDLVIYSDGTFGIINESEISAEQLLADGAWNVLSFGPALVENNDVVVSISDEVGRAKASNPRTAVGIIDALHYVFVVSDGRTNDSEGLSLYELATFMKTLGVKTAYNQDGGGSSTMVLNGVLINHPTTNGYTTKERSVSDIVYIGY